MKVYNKLVRDKIPDIIKSEGKYVKYKILNNEEYILQLNKKIVEEVNEYINDNNVEELADIVEVVYGILNHMNISVEEFEKIRKEKAFKKGGFKEKIFLEESE